MTAGRKQIACLSRVYVSNKTNKICVLMHIHVFASIDRLWEERNKTKCFFHLFGTEEPRSVWMINHLSPRGWSWKWHQCASQVCEESGIWQVAHSNTQNHGCTDIMFHLVAVYLICTCSDVFLVRAIHLFCCLQWVWDSTLSFTNFGDLVLCRCWPTSWATNAALWNVW